MNDHIYDKALNRITELESQIDRLKLRISEYETGRPMNEAPRDETEIIISSKKYSKTIYRWNDGIWYTPDWEYDISENEALRWWPLPGSDK
jgi:hypothetical protein